MPKDKVNVSRASGPSEGVPPEIKALREALKDKLKSVMGDIVTTHGYGWDRGVDDIMRVLADHNCGVTAELDISQPIAVKYGGHIDIKASVALFDKLMKDGWHRVIPITSDRG